MLKAANQPQSHTLERSIGCMGSLHDSVDSSGASCTYQGGGMLQSVAFLDGHLWASALCRQLACRATNRSIKRTRKQDHEYENFPYSFKKMKNCSCRRGRPWRRNRVRCRGQRSCAATACRTSMRSFFPTTSAPASAPMHPTRPSAPSSTRWELSHVSSLLTGDSMHVTLTIVLHMGTCSFVRITLCMDVCNYTVLLPS